MCGMSTPPTSETQEAELLREAAQGHHAAPQPAASGGQTTAFARNVGSLVENVFAGGTRREGSDADVFDAANFKQVTNSWWLDRALPGGVGGYFLAAFVICTVVWLIGLTARLIALNFENVGHEIWLFIWERQWQLTPLLLFLHFLSLRLFKGIYSRNFDKAFTHLDVTAEELTRYKRWFLGRRVNFFAIAIAAPFVLYEAFFFFSASDFYVMVFGEASQYVAKVDAAARNLEAWWLLAIWTFEWLMYGYYCYLMVAGALVVRRILKTHDFVDPVDLVLTERQYRPLFNVTAQAGSLVFVYGLIYAGYVFYTKGSVSDIAGLIGLVVLLGASFGVTWGGVRGELRGNVSAALNSLECSYREARTKLGTMKDVPGIEDDLQRVQVQLKMSLALQQMDYLQGKYESLGRKEFLGLVFKMLAPVGTVMARVIRWGSLIAALGLGSAAFLGGGEKPADNTPVQKAPVNAPANSGK